MQIKLHKITVRELAKGYEDNAENGVKAFSGKLDVRPPFQREFIYKEKQRDAVIDTLTNGFPLNVMYWACRSANSSSCREADSTPALQENIANEPLTPQHNNTNEPQYEIIDGQQRTISICQYINGDFAFNFRYFHNLTDNEKEEILNYELQVYICSGTDSEKLKWFRTINIAREKLTDQELRNAVYSGSWVSDAKRYFSKSNCAAYNLANKYLTGSPIRQDYLETALSWIARNIGIEIYMGNHQHDNSAIALWNYFQSVISWVKAVFPKYRKEMKGIDWGLLYDKFHLQNLNSQKLEEKISKLMQDSDIQKKAGIYSYILDGDERHLSIRTFEENTKREVYEIQQGICKICGKHFEIEQMEADHITPWSKGGLTIRENCQMLCKECNRRKAGK